jgi:hypothetical protein
MAMNPSVAAEARVLGRYLLGVDPRPELVERYREANCALFPEPPDPADAALLAFALRHRWSLGPLESALGWLAPRALLRRKLVVMTAILETEPALAVRFEAVCPGRARAVARLIGLGVRSSMKTLAGIVLYPLARRSRPIAAGSDEATGDV